MESMAVAMTEDGRVANRARRRLGLITAADAHEAGLSRHQIKSRLDAGRWELVARGVYSLAGVPSSSAQLVLAACLAGPPGTVASHASAAALFGLVPAPKVPHVSVAGRSSARNPLAVVHRVSLPDSDRTWVGPVPSTTPARTLVDLASVVLPSCFQGALDYALARRLVRPAQISSLIVKGTAARSRAGATVVRSALEPWTSGIAFESVMEVRLFRRLRLWGVPTPVGQYEVRRPNGSFVARLDLAWPDRLVGLEYQGKLAHSPSHAAHDEARIAQLESLGWRIEEVGVDDLQPGATRLLAVLRSLRCA